MDDECRISREMDGSASSSNGLGCALNDMSVDQTSDLKIAADVIIEETNGAFVKDDYHKAQTHEDNSHQDPENCDDENRVEGASPYLLDRQGNHSSANDTEDSSADTASSSESFHSDQSSESASDQDLETRRQVRPDKSSSRKSFSEASDGDDADTIIKKMNVMPSNEDELQDLHEHVQALYNKTFPESGSIVAYDSSSSSDESSDDDLTILRSKQSYRNVITSKAAKTEGELLLDDLPPIENLSLTADTNIELTLLGKISSIVDRLAVVESLEGSPGLDSDTVLFREDRTAIGKVFELFGPVKAPYFSIRFNSEQHIKDSGVDVGLSVYYAPERGDFSIFVIPSQLQLGKGSDASWKNDNEPPQRLLEYSDDETEKREKRKLRDLRRNKADGSGSDHSKLTTVRNRPKAIVTRNRKFNDTLPTVGPPQLHPVGMTIPGPSGDMGDWSSQYRHPHASNVPPPIHVGDWRNQPPPPFLTNYPPPPPSNWISSVPPPPTHWVCPPPVVPSDWSRPPPPLPSFSASPAPSPGLQGAAPSTVLNTSANPISPQVSFQSPSFPLVSIKVEVNDSIGTVHDTPTGMGSVPAVHFGADAAPSSSASQVSLPHNDSGMPVASPSVQETSTTGQGDQFKHLFNQYFEYYSNYYQSQNSAS